MIQNFETFIRRGGNGARTLLLRKDEPQPSRIELRTTFVDRLDAAAQENERMLLRTLTQLDTIPAVTPSDLSDPSDLRAAALERWDAQIGLIGESGARAVSEDRLLRAFASALNEMRQRALGVESYVWRTQDDGKVRTAHAARAGLRFRWNDVPEGGHPGQDHNCRCVAVPVPVGAPDALVPIQFSPDGDGGVPPQDLALHEDRGGHTIALHVGKSSDFLLGSISTPRVRTFFVSVYRWRHGTFPSLEAAQRLTNSNLARNVDIVNSVATGRLRRAFVTSDFSSVTGTEAYRMTQRVSSSLQLRQTFGVGTVIEHAPDMPDGFVIITSYPRND